MLWEGSGWNAPQMTDLVETGKVKKQYMKANLIIHPDKVQLPVFTILDLGFEVRVKGLKTLNPSVWGLTLGCQGVTVMTALTALT